MALTAGAICTCALAVGFLVWCAYRARVRAARIQPRRSSHGKPTSPKMLAATSMEKPPANVRVKYTTDTLQVAGSYVVYTIELTWAGGVHKVIERRYSEFDHLVAQVKKQMKALKTSNISLPPLPRKSILLNFDDSFLEGRRRGLEGFMGFVARHPVISEFVCVREFCGL
ncbi:Aste57867_8714 [Aphanomyces stellatus]|uniref:Aste57867_8714 protein n=1 Tax=Aphanomyces stellatus TaxID=120398 RepID=A0A485KKZ2_9STRA|nr:hypothetical protein As57867_008680 [Aphanomyces stellatus]VFT85600.1 Aste57867_8714 [Aphanomyces stellatus]